MAPSRLAGEDGKVNKVNMPCLCLLRLGAAEGGRRARGHPQTTVRPCINDIEEVPVELDSLETEPSGVKAQKNP
ncbi:hypothetical protein GE21DRAFT_1342983 [Neurospora crassa]|nr:hypothetical protein GE21DRAFT_1342983 [Neurospora crassa]